MSDRLITLPNFRGIDFIIMSLKVNVIEFDTLYDITITTTVKCDVGSCKFDTIPLHTVKVCDRVKCIIFTFTGGFLVM